MKTCRFFLLFSFFLLALTGALTSCSGVKDPAPEKPKQELSKLSIEEAANQELHEINLDLGEGSQLDIYYQRESWRPLAIKIAHIIHRSHSSYTAIFGKLPPTETTLAVIDRDLFHVKTESPDWIDAIYHRGRIFVPISDSKRLDYHRLYRSLKHEYTHAIVDKLSGGKCPGWIDEGLAQWAEGEEDPAAKYLLAKWLATKDPIPLRDLQGGFMTMDKEIAKTGYAQSLYAVNNLIDIYGVNPLAAYFSDLREGTDSAQAFYKNYGIRTSSFEKRLQISLKRWAVKERRDDL